MENVKNVLPTEFEMSVMKKQPVVSAVAVAAEDNIYLTLWKVQKELKAPKSQINKFGNYPFRNCEDILEAVKKVLPPEAIIVMTDDLVLLGDRYYVKANATFKYKGAEISSSSWAREPAAKKGFDESQITGTASSYARKYALGGLLLIDDNKDADNFDNRAQGHKEEIRDYSEKALLRLIDQLSVKEDWINTSLLRFKVASIHDLTNENRATMINFLLKKQSQRRQLISAEKVISAEKA